MSNGNGHVGLLVDFENLVLAFNRPGKASVEVNLLPVIDFLEENFGDVIFRRAYADWGSRDFKAHESSLQDLGVEMVHVVRRTPSSKKNGADILLTADAVECLLLRPFISDFAVLSGDSDIGPLVTKLKSHGKSVVVIGPDARSTAKHVIELADRFKYYTDIVQPKSSKRKKKGTGPKTPQRAVLDILRRADGPLESASLKRELLQTKGFADFKEKALGFKTWTSFLKSIDGLQVNRRSDLGIEVSLTK